MFHTKIVEKIKTHISYSIPFFFENHTVYEIMWKNIVDPDRRKRNVRWITKVTDTLRICITSCSSTATIVARPRLKSSLHVYCLSLINLTLLNGANEKTKDDKFTGTRQSKVGTGPDYFAHVFPLWVVLFVNCSLSHLPQVILEPETQSFQFSVKTKSAGPPLLGCP